MQHHGIDNDNTRHHYYLLARRPWAKEHWADKNGNENGKANHNT